MPGGRGRAQHRPSSLLPAPEGRHQRRGARETRRSSPKVPLRAASPPPQRAGREDGGRAPLRSPLLRGRRRVLAAVRRTRGGALSPSLSLSPSPGTACRGRCSLGSGVLPPFSCWTPAEESASPSPELPTRSGPTSEKTAEETQKRRLNEILTIITCLFNNSTPQSRLLAGTFRWNH